VFGGEESEGSLRPGAGHLAFQNGQSHEVAESAPNIILELDENREIMGLEIWNAKKAGIFEQVAKAAIGS